MEEIERHPHHGEGRARHPDWYKNSFIMVVYEN